MSIYAYQKYIHRKNLFMPRGRCVYKNYNYGYILTSVYETQSQIYSSKAQSISSTANYPISAMAILHHFSLISQCGVKNALLPPTDCGVSQK